jgi:hypothetical protein
MDVGKDSGKKPNGVNVLTRSLTEGTPFAGVQETASTLLFTGDKR